MDTMSEERLTINQTNESLRGEFEDCRQQLRELRERQELIEKTVEKRTAALKKKNKQLRKEAQRRRTMEDTLVRERNLLRALIDSIPDHFYIKDANSRFILCNQRLARQAGLESPDQMIGKTDHDFMRPELADKYLAQEKEILRTGIPLINEEQIGRDSQANDIWVLSSKIPLYDRRGNIIGLIGSNRDITQIKLAEQELAAYQEKIVQAERISQLGLLSATMGHELNQPLTVIQLLLQDSLEELLKKSRRGEIAENLRDCLEEVEAVNGIIRRYRNILQSRQEGAGRDVHIHRVAARITRALMKTAEKQRFGIVVEDLKSLPPVRGKIQDFEQIFFILLQNAIQASNPKSGRTVRIAGRRLDAHIEICFQDDCGGIAPEHLDKIFDLFYTTKPPQIGTGFGLPIARRIVQSYGGDLSVESQFGQGSKFFVTIPLSEEAGG
jgi:two-component system, sensor histidine kinase and response regulator